MNRWVIRWTDSKLDSKEYTLTVESLQAAELLIEAIDSRPTAKLLEFRDLS